MYGFSLLCLDSSETLFTPLDETIKRVMASQNLIHFGFETVKLALVLFLHLTREVSTVFILRPEVLKLLFYFIYTLCTLQS